MIEIPGFTVTEADPATAAVSLLVIAEELGYVRPSDEWVDGTGEPLPDDMQDAAHRLVEAGLLPEFEEAIRG
ncbi:hypothetical protein JOF56_011654 [Kibdelosporangium banguiense]|uniref:Uncharacterized protein n=1 Tax=Kibdelosporangium banguiense TaxID=1365924 RepID=A0ABS4U4Y4_9PSEU|nr:hypothetical protein [Kibdelosporangium banguiense]MBP2331269.1 hypothetical protein [Kibdelosporangium banguiense]